MPIMDGFDSASEIFKFQQTQNLARYSKIVALTAFQNEETITRCLKIGMKKVYNKPASQNDIRNIFFLNFYDLQMDSYLTYQKIEEQLKH